MALISTATTASSTTTSASRELALTSSTAIEMIEETEEVDDTPPPRRAKEQIEEIVVTGSRTEKRLSDAPVTTEVISREEMVREGAENLADALEKQPGVELTRSTSGVGVQLQGLDVEHVLILVDGERVTGRYRGSVDPSRFDLANIQQVEIVKGGSSALYGSEAIGGVINMITRESKKPFESSARASYGSFGTFDGTGAAGAHVGGLRASISGGYHRSDGYDLVPDDIGTTGPSYSSYDAAANLSYKFSDALKIKARGDYLQLDQDAVDYQKSTNGTFDRAQNTEVISISGGPEVHIGDSRLKLSAHWSWFRFQFAIDQRGGTSGDSYQDDHQQVGQLTAQYDIPVADTHLLTAGAEGLLELEEVQFLDPPKADRKRAAIFLQDEWTAIEESNHLVLVPGVRADIDSQFGSRVSPKMAARWDPTDDVVVRASFGVGFRAPTFEELYVRFENPGSGYHLLGNPNLKPENSIGVNAGAEYHATEQVEVSANFFFNDVDNLIDYQRKPECSGTLMPPDCVQRGDLQEFNPVNIARARTGGVETLVQLHVIEGLTVEVGYVLTLTQDLEAKHGLPGRAPHKGTFRVTYHDDDLGLDAAVRTAIVGRRHYFTDLDGDGRDESAAPYVALSARAAKTLFGHFSIFIGAENLLDTGDPLVLPIAPRSFYGGLSARYDLEEQ